MYATFMPASYLDTRMSTKKLSVQLLVSNTVRLSNSSAEG
jgi:hypothetical protein